MKAYVITSGEYSSYGIEHISLDKKKAYAFADYLNNKGKYNYYDYYNVEEFELDDFDIDAENIKIGYLFIFGIIDGKAKYLGRMKCRIDNHKNEIELHERYERYMKIKIWINKADKDVATKIAQDIFAKWKSEQEEKQC